MIKHSHFILFYLLVHDKACDNYFLFNESCNRSKQNHTMLAGDVGSDGGAKIACICHISRLVIWRKKCCDYGLETVK